MAVPALVIGLGGTGQWVVTYLKKSLIETYGQIPPEVKLRSFDTVATSRAGVSDRPIEQQQIRVEERTVAGVKLEAGEYIHIGGFVREFVRDVAQDEEGERYPHLRSWLQAKYYLDNLPDAQFHLDEGAGQFRQMGRLAIFYDLRAATVSLLHGQLSDTIQELQRTTTAQNLQVFVIGSLAGGTGAGMFVDVAHLVRQIAAQQAKMQVTVRGYLVLPEAFSGSISANASVKRGMNARAFAAMRENKRFAVSFDWELGYPIPYRAPTMGRQPDPVLEGTMKGQLFDTLYYIDGHRRNFPLFSVKLEQGIAPSITDMISAILDDRASGAFQEHTKNLQAVLAARGPSRGIPYYGSLGTYSIVMPIAHIIEGFSHQLALEVLQTLLQPSKIDDRTKLPTALADNRNREVGEGYSGANAARDLLTCASVLDPQDPTLSVDNTLLLPELVDIAERFSSNEATSIDLLSGRGLSDWDRYFAPAGSAEDIVKARERADTVINVRLIDEVPLSRDVTPRERPVDGVHRIEHGVRNHKNIYLGAEQSATGQRIGGKYREALTEYANVHFNRFRRMLEFKTREILNGRSTTDPVLAKGGKLGYYRDSLARLALYFDQSYQALTRVMERRRSQNAGRSQAIAAAQNALSEMKARATDTMPIIGRAHKTQQEYLDQEQMLIDIHKLEILEQVVADTVRQMGELVSAASANLDSWIAQLGTGSNSLYARLLSAKYQIEANRDREADLECRLTLGSRRAGREEDADYRKFKQYEKERYEFYVYDNGANQVAATLGALNWQVSSDLQRGKPAFKLEWVMGVGSTTTRRRLDADPVGEAMERLLNHTRSLFTPMKQKESAVGYLLYAYSSPDQLAELIHARSGPLLGHDASGPVPANYLRAYYGEETAQADFLRALLKKLASLSSITNLDQFARLVNSADRFSCTLVHTLDLIDLDRIDAYTQARNEYLGFQGEGKVSNSQRTILHLFPAEVNAVQFEERLPHELNQVTRMFTDSVVWQLEKLDNLRLFLFCYAHGMIAPTAITGDQGQTLDYFQLNWTPIHDRDSGEVWLTKPVDQDPSLLEAIMTFNYLGKDVRYSAGFSKQIDYDTVRRSLEQRQQEDLQARRAQGNLGTSDPNTRNWLETQEVSESDPVWLWMARHDNLSDLEKEWTDSLPRLYAQLKEDRSAQDDYDLMSVFVLILRDEMERLNRRIRNRAPAPKNRSGENQPTASPQRESPWVRRGRG